MADCLVKSSILIDDSDIDLFIQRRFLEVNRFSEEIVIYRSAQGALDWLATQSADSFPQIIFLDLNMPDIDGFTFLERFKDLPKELQQKAVIVVLTSSNSTQDREKVSQYPNVVQFITKPLKQTDISKLAELIKKK